MKLEGGIVWKVNESDEPVDSEYVPIVIADMVSTTFEPLAHPFEFESSNWIVLWPLLRQTFHV